MWQAGLYQNLVRKQQEGNIDAEEHLYLPVREKGSKTSVWLLAFAIVVSNTVWALVNFHHSRPCTKFQVATYLDDHSTKILRPHHWNTDFSNDDKDISSPLWSSLFPTGAGIVTLSNSWAIEHSLPSTMSDPSNSSNSIYFAAVYHQLHCLTVLRASLYHFSEQVEQTVPWMHVTHCLDSIRQALMCSRDETLLYSEDGKVFGDGQVHSCRNWDALHHWVEQHAYTYED